MLKKILLKSYGFALNFQALFSEKLAGKKAFDIYCTVRKGKVLPIQKAFLDNAKHELVETSNHQIQTYRWPGSGKRVLLVHGWESNVHRWNKLITKLHKANFDVLAFDAPGHGNSSGKILHHPLYEKTLQHLIQKYNPSYIIGHSMGGMTIMYNQYLNPDSVIEKIVTLASPSEYYELMRFYRNLLSLSKKTMSGLQNHIKSQFGFAFQELSSSEFAKTNKKTGLLVHDKQDSVTPYWCSEQVHANWKHSKLVTTEGLGHSIQDDTINNEIVAFLRS